MRRFASLALASFLFALLTGVVGWFWGQFFTNLLSHLAGQGYLVSITVSATFTGAITGVLLAPTRGSSEEAEHPSPAHITAVVLAGGAVAGGLGVMMHAPGDVGLGIGCGFLCAILLIPAAALEIAILKRIGRARRGSVLARADGRALVATTIGLLGCSAGLAAVGWPAAAVDLADPPHKAVILILVAAAVVAIALVADLVVQARVERWASLVASEGGPPPNAAALPTGRLDLGLGEELAASTAPGMAYRGGGRLLASVAGDIDETLATLRRSIRRGAALLVLLEAAGVAHGMARGTDVAAHYGAWLCDDGRLEECRDAALLAERAGQKSEATRLHTRACENQQEESCLAIELMRRSEGPLW